MFDPLEDGPWDLDRRLWVNSDQGDHGYIAAGTSRNGRFSVYRESEGAVYACAIWQIESCSPVASAWLHGYLEGQRPTPWFSDPFDPKDLEDPRNVAYENALLMFRWTGVWRSDRDQVCGECGASFHPEGGTHRALPSNPVGDVCFTCRPVALGSAT